ncbi:MAG: hypothetical protein ACX936_02860 [Marinobacter sp.]
MIGYRLLSAVGLGWRNNQGGLFPLSPPFMLADFDSSCARKVMISEGALFLRWESDFDNGKDTPWWHIIKEGSCSLTDLSSNTRSKVRRGLKAYDCGPLTRSEVFSEGYDVYCSAFARYETHECQFSKDEFFKAIKALPENSEFWGVREKDSGRLVAFSENYIENMTCFYNSIWFEPASLKRYSSYALFFEMNRHYIEERLFRYVSDGARNLSHSTEIHDFLVAKFGFRKAYARLRVVYRPWLGVVVKLAYPFRNLIGRVPLGLFSKARILLKQEEVRRECEELSEL